MALPLPLRAQPGQDAPGAAAGLASTAPKLPLPPAQLRGAMSLEAALARRRSVRNFAAAALTRAQLAQLLWAAQGLSGAPARRTAPSAGALYPLVLYVVAGRVEEVPTGIYRYDPAAHHLRVVAAVDARAAVAAAALSQAWLRDAAILIIVAAEPSRVLARYGARAARFIAIETGAATQNLQLQAAALGLGATLVGAFDETMLRQAVPVPASEEVLAIVAIGAPA